MGVVSPSPKKMSREMTACPVSARNARRRFGNEQARRLFRRACTVIIDYQRCRSKRSFSITLTHAETKSSTILVPPSSAA